MTVAMGIKYYAVSLFLFLLFPELLQAQTPDMVEKSILLIVSEDEDAATGMLEDVIVDSMALEFLLNDFRVRISEKAEGDDSSEEKRAREVLFDEARESGSLFLLEGRYRIEDDRVLLQLECLRVDRDASLYAGREEYPVDLNLDNAIQNSIRKVVASIESDLRDNPPEKMTGRTVDEPGPMEKDAVPGKPLPSQDQSVLSGRSGRRITGMAEYGLFIPVGESRDYFDLGSVPALGALYPVSLPFGILEFGGFISLNVIHAEGQMNSSQNLLVFLAPLIRYRIPLGERFACFFRLAPGGTLLMVNRNSEGFQGVMIPALQTGAGGEYVFREEWGFLWGADLSLSFEESITITGIQPSVGVYYRL